MKKRNEPKFTYKDTYTKCEIFDPKYGRTFVGEAHCHPDDADFQSLITGSTLAELRASTKALISYKNDLRVKIEALQQYLYSINQSKQFNPSSYEVVMLMRQIKMLKLDLEEIKEEIRMLKIHERKYINEKDRVYKYLREKRNENNK